MQRVMNWPSALADYIAACMAKKFNYGEFDCAQFCAGAIKAITGADLLPMFSEYSTTDEARAIADSFDGMAGIADSVLGERVEKAFAQRGDIVLIESNSQDGFAHAFGVCVGATLLTTAANGLRSVPMSQALCAWRVG